MKKQSEGHNRLGSVCFSLVLLGHFTAKDCAKIPKRKRLSLHTLIFLDASVLTWSPTEARVRPRATHDIVKRELSYYEELYISTLDFKLPNNTIKLVGCVNIRVPSY
jgi:hypothetical protein